MPRIASVLCLASLGLLASCSAFDWQWMQTDPLPSANPAALLDGKWEGTWQSDATDYAGHIQSIAIHTTQTIVDQEAVQQYEASFRLKWYEIGFQEFTLTLNSTKMDNGRIHFEGKKDMGFGSGGILRLDGYIFPDKDEMYCDYANDKDSGTYKLRRIVKELQ
jgi:hypothetical protein